jgi:hypothetical protein
MAACALVPQPRAQACGTWAKAARRKPARVGASVETMGKTVVKAPLWCDADAGTRQCDIRPEALAPVKA